MNIAASIKQFFSQYKIRYQTFAHARTVTLEQARSALNINANAFARSVLLGDEHGYILAVVPLSRKLDFSLLNKRLKRNLTVIQGSQVDRIFHDCEPGSHPVLGDAYGLRTIIDTSLSRLPYIYFEPGTHTCVVRISQLDFRFLQSKTIWAPISVDMSVTKQGCDWDHSKELQDKLINIHNPCLENIAKRVEAIYPLPPLPRLAHDIYELTTRSDVSGRDLLELVEQDPNLTQWLMQHVMTDACQPLESLEQAIDTLGFSRVCHMALGAVAGRIFQVPASGPIGLDAFWQHSYGCAQLVRELSCLSTREDYHPAKAFLCGLMHNFGVLLFAHLFGPEFKMLNKMVAFQPDIPIEVHEKRMLGLGQANNVLKIGHAGMGAWLLQSWGFAPEVVTCAKHHHDIHYHGEHSHYNQLVLIANTMLKMRGVGDGFIRPWEALPLTQAGLSVDQLTACFERCPQVTLPSNQSFGIAR